MYQFSDKTDNFDFLGPNLPKNGFWCQIVKNLSLVLKSASLRYYVYQYSDKTDNFEYLAPNLPKTQFWGRNSDKTDNFDFLGPNLPKNGFRNQHPWDIMCTNFQTKRTNLNFWAQICPKIDVGVRFQKSNSGFGFKTSTISYVSIFSQNGQHLVFDLNLGKLSNYVQYFG